MTKPMTSFFVKGWEGGRGHSISGRSFRGVVSPQRNIYVIMQGKVRWPPLPPPQTHHLLPTLLPGSTDRSVRPRKPSLGTATGSVLLNSGVIHTVPKMNKSTELIGADTGLRQERSQD